MGKYRKILISGSNAHIRALKVSDMSDNSNTSLKVVVYDTGTGQFYFTGSYQDAGTTPTFPGTYEGDINLTVASGASTTRQIIIGKDRDTAGEAKLLLSTGSNNQGLHIERASTENGNSTITHHGNGDFLVGLNNGNSTNNINQFRVSRLDGGSYVDLFRVASNGDIFMDQLSNINSGFQLRYDQNTKQLSFFASSRKIKQDITPLNNKILAKFDKLNPVTFKYKSNLDQVIGGFIAEEIAEIDPILAQYGPDLKINENGTFSKEKISENIVPVSLSDRAILAIIVAKIQELDSKIKELKKIKQDGTV